jgi:PhnB protein
MAKAIPDTFMAVTPYLVVRDVNAQLDFMVKAFNANVVMKMDTPKGIGHADVMIFGSHVMMGPAHDQHPAMPAMVHLYVQDCDKVHAQAVAAGGAVVMPVTDMFYGDRAGSVRDVNGNVWYISTHHQDVAPDELQKRMMAEFAKHEQQKKK